MILNQVKKKDLALSVPKFLSSASRNLLTAELTIIYHSRTNKKNIPAKKTLQY